VYCVDDVEQVEIHTAEAIAPDPNYFEVEIAIAKMNKRKFLGTDQILLEMIQAVVETLQSEIYEHINCFWNKAELCKI
jgi:hypothetical protein